MVVFSHLIACFLVLSTPAYKTKLLSFISDGRLAVFIFFVLSGYALSASQHGKKNLNLSFLIIARYLRLAIPIFVTGSIAYILLKSGLFFNLAAATTPETSSDWLGTFYKFKPGILHAIQFSLYDVFFSYDGARTYNPALWTMTVELIGSVLIYFYLATVTKRTKGILVATGAMAAFLLYKSPYYACFAFGFLIYELNSRVFIKRNYLTELASIGCFSAIPLISTFYRPDNDKITCLMAVVVILSVSQSDLLRAFFSNPVSRFLGKISFPLYLIQLIVICSISSYLFITLPQHGISGLTASNIIVVITLIISLLLACALLPVEKFSIEFSKRAAKNIVAYVQAIDSN